MSRQRSRNRHKWQSLTCERLEDRLALSGVAATATAPITISTIVPSTTVEGQTVTLTATATGGTGALTYAWDLDDDGVFETPGASAPKTFDDNGVYSVRIQVTDALGQSAVAVRTVSVSNMAPNLRLRSTYSRRVGEPFILISTVTDPSRADTAAGFHYAWDFGDGRTLSGHDLSTTSHAYSTPGNYVVKLRVTDKDGGMRSLELRVLVRPANW